LAYSVHDHIRLRRVSSIAASPDGTWIAVSVERLDREGAKYVSDLWKVPIDGSAAVQLTRGDTKDKSPCFRHDGSLAFLSNRQPNETKPDEDAEKRMQIWVLPAGGGEPQQRTDEPLGVEAFKFAKNADRLVLFSPVLSKVPFEKQRETFTERAKKGPGARRFTQQPVRHWDHWLHENPDLPNVHAIAYGPGEGSMRREDLTPEASRDFSIEPRLDISDDGRMVALIRQSLGTDRIMDTTILVIDLESKKETPFGLGTNVNHERPRFSPDGRMLATVETYRSAQAVVRPLLKLIDIVSGESRTLAKDWDRWPHLESWTNDSAKLVVTADDEGTAAVFTIDAVTGRCDRVTARSSGGAHSGIVTLKDGRLAGIRSTLRDAPECFVVSAEPDSTPATLSRLSGFAEADWAEVENCHVASTDGTPIQFFLMKPRGAAGRLPVLLWIHGGPISMDADGWHWRWNPLLAVAQGYAVVLPNPRGSTGFGQEFIQGIWGNVWGGQCYRDLMCVADAVEARSDIDPKRIMAMGGSFGGYMTNWIGTQTDRFRCLVTHASIFTMAHFTGTTDHPPWWYLEMGGEDPFKDQARFDRYAPVQHVRNWKTPTLIIHGELDYRCPIGEGLNLFEALQYHGVPSELLIFPDENHWILKPRNAVVWYETVLEFIRRHMVCFE
jgi:dipeptidyl aminopeptidase/acylaminoacyl peptidase